MTAIREGTKKHSFYEQTSPTLAESIAKLSSDKRVSCLFASGPAALSPLLPHFTRPPFTSICPFYGLSAFRLAYAHAKTKGLSIMAATRKEVNDYLKEQMYDAPLLVIVPQALSQEPFSPSLCDRVFETFSCALSKVSVEKQAAILEIPVSFLTQENSFASCASPFSFNPYLLSQALFFSQKILLSAKAPVIAIGGKLESEEAYTALLQFAETFRLPLAVAKGAKGAISERHPLFIGIYDELSLEEMVTSDSSYDCVIALGGEGKACYQKKAPLFANHASLRIGQKSFSSLPLDAYLRALCKISWELPFFSQRARLIQKQATPSYSSLTVKRAIRKEDLCCLLSEQMTDAHLLALSPNWECFAQKITVEKNCYCPPSSCSLYPLGAALALPHKRLLFLIDEEEKESFLPQKETIETLGLTPLFLVATSSKETKKHHGRIEDLLTLKSTLKHALQEPTKYAWIEYSLGQS